MASELHETGYLYLTHKGLEFEGIYSASAGDISDLWAGGSPAYVDGSACGAPLVKKWP